MKLIDTHAHLDFPRFKKDRDEVIARALDGDIELIFNIGADLKSSRRSLELSKQYTRIYATVGIHPHEAKTLDDEVLEEVRKMAEDEKVVAIGEIGLDYYYDNSPRELQKKALRKQLRLARELNLPVVIHNRDGDKDILEVFKEEKIEEIGGIMHCFSSGLEMARTCLDLGFYLAFGGVITFKNATEARKVVKEVPLERILLETDSPYLTPHPHRGKRNEPSFVRYVAEKIAEIKGVSLEEVAQITTANALKAYRIEEG